MTITATINGPMKADLQISRSSGGPKIFLSGGDDAKFQSGCRNLLARIFLRMDVNSRTGCANLLFCNFVAENCKKMKEFEPSRKKTMYPW